MTCFDPSGAGLGRNALDSPLDSLRLRLALAAASNRLATKAWSQAIRADNPAPAGQSYLTGDWGGLRSYLERNGVTLTLTNTTDFLANVSGGIKTGAVGLGAVQPQLDLDLQKLAGWQGGLVHVHGLVTYGPLFSANYLGNILPCRTSKRDRWRGSTRSGTSKTGLTIFGPSASA